MENALLISMYRDSFLSLHCQVNGGNQNKAKPILLLAILQLIDDRIANNNMFYFDDVLKKYCVLQKQYNIKAPCHYPTYYLDTEDFYHLKWKKTELKVKVPSCKFIRENIEYIYLDNALWDLLQKDQIRDSYSSSIVNYYLKNV